MKNIISLVTAFSLCAAMPAMANMDKNMHGKSADSWFNKMDTNGDGMISKAEHDAFGDRMFNEADTNNDGVISRQEMAAAKKMHDRDPHMARWEKNDNLNPAAGPTRDMSSTTRQSQVLGTEDNRD